MFLTGGYGAGSAMIRVRKNGPSFVVDELFTTQAAGSQIHQPLLHQGHLYMNSNSNRRRDGMLCMDLAGAVKWKTGRAPNFERGPMLLADGLIFNLDGSTGVLHLIEPSPDGYKELARAAILAANLNWSPMALTDGKLLLRGEKHLKCLDVRAP